jgi:hypothetical protein
MSRARAISEALGGSAESKNSFRSRCPVCGHETLTLQDAIAGRLIARCWHGCTGRQVYGALRRRGLLGKPRPLSPAEIEQQRAEAERKRRKDAALVREILAETVAIDGTLGARYLASRVIHFLPRALRLHRHLWHSPGVYRPAMVAVVTHVEHGIVAVHATYLAIDGSCKAALTPQRKSIGSVGGGAVHLSDDGSDRLVVSEGIETGASLVQASKTPIATWAALSTSGLKTLVLPPGVRRITIAADHDEAGIDAARKAALRWVREGRQVRIALPSEPGADFNDLLLTAGAHHGR